MKSVLLHLWLSDSSEVVCKENQLVHVGREKGAPWFIGNETRLWKKSSLMAWRDGASKNQQK